jgi:hypothetical protein
MANTKNRVTANNAENNGENNQDANPPPSPPLTLEQVLAMQAHVSDDAADHGQHACTTPSATATER